ncbi:ABC-three component system protein [Kaistia terrae]|uniref:ABC-three component system protein n=1 Tax=Kaistia terrae TaxID=537017 RepID=A0ABW0Q0P5_9HYPH|nr:ABC-three component system protein [Kaistia terrae]MCX5581641.1 hypothetical protein [Kaistia terrae]
MFFLGCFEKRVTVYSQQVRAINLVAAILDQGLVRAEGRVAIVGGGAAGLTAAVAFARGAPGLRVIHVYEKLPEVLQLQQNSGRYLHPHNYDWPAESAANPSAGLPFMNWRAGLARDVQRHLRDQFDEVARTSAIELRVNTSVSGVVPFERMSARVLLGTGPHVPEIYDVVILSVGFGLERSISGVTPSYWTVSELESPILAPGVQPIFISGNGDGGLVDFMSAALVPMTHKQICEFIVSLDIPLAKAELALIDQEAWAAGAAIDLREAYRTRVMPLVPPSIFADVGERLRRNVTVRLHTNELQLFKRDTAVLNRFGCALLLEVDRNFHYNALQITTGASFVGDVPLDGDITLEGEAPFRPFRRYLRLGPDTAANLGPFQALRERMPADALTPPPIFRPATPGLSVAAVAAFGTFQTPDAPVVAASRPADEAALGLRIDRAANGDLLMTCELAPEAFGLAWRNQRPLVVDCALRPTDSPQLLALLARFGGHAPSATIYAADRRRWDELLRDAVRGRAMPSDISFHFRVEDLRPLSLAVGSRPLSVAAFVETAQAALDAETLANLQDALFDVLARPDPMECGWVIETELRGALWGLWQTWRVALDANVAAIRRFLLLLADDEDFIDVANEPLVRVGPKTLRAHLLKATLFALAFVLGAGKPLGPALAHPGNLQGDGLSGHACGVSWIEGRVVGPRVAELNWSAAIILLAELRVAAEFLYAEPRLDLRVGDRPRVGEVALAERPLILGADDVFLNALEAGRPALSAYLDGVIDARAAAAANLIEV